MSLLKFRLWKLISQDVKWEDIASLRQQLSNTKVFMNTGDLVEIP